jgi:hypothetical protein
MAVLADESVVHGETRIFEPNPIPDGQLGPSTARVVAVDHAPDGLAPSVAGGQRLALDEAPDAPGAVACMEDDQGVRRLVGLTLGTGAPLQLELVAGQVVVLVVRGAIGVAVDVPTIRVLLEVPEETPEGVGQRPDPSPVRTWILEQPVEAPARVQAAPVQAQPGGRAEVLGPVDRPP